MDYEWRENNYPAVHVLLSDFSHISILSAITKENFMDCTELLQTYVSQQTGKNPICLV